MLQNLRVAIVCDWLTNFAGAEQVIFSFHRLFPNAPIFTSLFQKTAMPGFEDAIVRPSFLQHFPGAKRHHQWYLPLMPYAFENIDLSDFDIVLSSSHSCAKGVLTQPRTMHVSYCHSPMRYVWDDCHAYIRDYQPNIFFRPFLPGFLKNLRLWDRVAADRVDYFVANSEHVRRRIQKYYQRESTVIHPPVDTSKFQISHAVQDYFLAVGRLIPYKRFDLLVDTANTLKLSLTIVGDGREYRRLKARAGNTIRFEGYVPPCDLAVFYARAQALLFPQEEDFGIAPLESQASGRPVIAYAKGGARETIIDGKTGVFFEEQTVDAIVSAIKKFRKIQWKPAHLKAHAQTFDRKLFEKRMETFLHEAWKTWQTHML